MRTLIFEDLKDKYFQSTLNPLIIIEGPSSIEQKMMGELESKFSCWAPLEQKFYNLSLDELNKYIEIPKSHFKTIKLKYKKGLMAQIEEDFSKFLNKPNLSE